MPTLSAEYFARLNAAILKTVPEALEDDWSGSVYVKLPFDGYLYATPGWEGQNCPFQVLQDGRVYAAGDVNVEFIGELEEDVESWRIAVRDLLLGGLYGQ